MKGRIIASAIVLIMILSSFGAVGNSTESEVEDDCGCNGTDENNFFSNTQSYSMIDSNGNYRVLGELSEWSHDPSLGMTFMGSAPSSFSWKDYAGKNWDTPVKNQKDCGSCWAFGTIAPIESRMNILSLNPSLNKDLSEQYMVSCASNDLMFCDGCKGAKLNTPIGFDNFIDWVVDKDDKHAGHDTVSESCFPYEAVDSNGCKADHSDGSENCGYDPVVCIRSCSEAVEALEWGWVDDDKESIKNALLAMGPLLARMDVYDDFFYYTGGIYKHELGEYRAGHIIAIVGYNEDEDYWICKNSWGSNWGEDGYFRIAYGECGIQKDVAYIEIDYGDPTDSKYADEYYKKDDRWEPYGDGHAMRCDNIGGLEEEKIYYTFPVPKDTEDPIVIGVEFYSQSLHVEGPDLEVYHPTNGWIKIKKSLGDNKNKVWKRYTVFNDYISTSNELKFRILCPILDLVLVDDVSVKYTEPAPPPESELEVEGSIVNPHLVPPGSKVTGSFKVKNIGDLGSMLDWEVKSCPNFGSEWSFDPSSGEDLLKNEFVIVDVSFRAPGSPYVNEHGDIIVVNKDDSSDVGKVGVAVNTPRNRGLFFNLVELLKVRFPLLFDFLNVLKQGVD